MDKRKDADREKILKEVVADYESTHPDAPKEARKNPGNDAKSKMIRSLFLGSAVLLVILLIGRLGFIVFSEEINFEKKLPLAKGIRLESDYLINECIYNLWKVREAADKYYADKNKFPEHIRELYGENYLSGKTVCPATGIKYVINTSAGKKYFDCPTAYEHGVSMVRCGARGGAPFVERE